MGWAKRSVPTSASRVATARSALLPPYSTTSAGMTEWWSALSDVNLRRVLGVVQNGGHDVARMHVGEVGERHEAARRRGAADVDRQRRGGAVLVVGHLDEVGHRLPTPERGIEQRLEVDLVALLVAVVEDVDEHRRRLLGGGEVVGAEHEQVGARHLDVLVESPVSGHVGGEV